MSNFAAKQPPNLLTIPLELRQQIYQHLLHINPIHNPHLATLSPPRDFSGMNTEEFHTMQICPNPVVENVTKTVCSYSDSGIIERLYQDKKRETVRGKVPTALLVSCRQIYGEARILPWQENEWKFVNWFWSGIYSARKFGKDIRSWQVEGMRYVGIEILTGDLGVNGSSSTSREKGDQEEKEKKWGNDWIELCELWKGVTVLKLCIKGSVVISEKLGSIIVGEDVETLDKKLGSIQQGRTILDISRPWITDGLLELRSLSLIELEISDENSSRESKAEFCAGLERVFRKPQIGEMNHPREVKVILVERTKIQEKEAPNKEFQWFGGVPGNDSVWGMDVEALVGKILAAGCAVEGAV